VFVLSVVQEGLFHSAAKHAAFSRKPKVFMQSSEQQPAFCNFTSFLSKPTPEWNIQPIENCILTFPSPQLNHPEQCQGSWLT